MTPSAVFWHDSLPLTGNGKVDRGKLIAMTPLSAAAVAPSAGAARTGETTDLQRRLIELWASVLRTPSESIDPGSDFYDLGGDSLAAARILTGVRKQFGVAITLDRLYEVRTVLAMAAVIDVSRAATAGTAAVIAGTATAAGAA